MSIEKNDSDYKKGFDFIENNKIDVNWLFCVSCKGDQIPYKCMRYYGFPFVKELFNRYDINLSCKDEDGNTAFENSIINGRTEIARWLIENCGVDPKKEKKNALLLAAGSGTHLNLDLIKYLIEDCGFDVNFRDEEGNTPLIIAVKNGGPWCGVMEVAKYLIAHGADVNAKDNDGHNMFYLVVWDEYYYSDEDISWLLDAGADCLTLDDSVERIWFRAASLGRLSIIKFLVDKHMIDPQCRDGSGNTAVHIAASALQIEVVKWFVEEAGVNVNDKGRDGMTIMGFAVFSVHNQRDLYDREYRAGIIEDRFEFVKWLVDKGADISVIDDYYRTLLHLAVTDFCIIGTDNTDELELLKWLASHGVDIEEVNGDDQEDVLSIAWSFGNMTVFEYLINEAGYDIDFALIKAVVDFDNDESDGCDENGEGDGLDKIRWLVSHGANLFSVDVDGEIPICIAAELGNVKELKYFIEEVGVDINSKCPEWFGTPLHCAIYGLFGDDSNFDVVKWLVNHGADIHCIDNEGDTVLHYAAKDGLLKVAKYFVEECHMNPGIKNPKTGKTPADYAKGNSALVRYLHKKEKEYNGN